MATLDLAGIITRICTDLKTRFSKVTFTQGLASGTQVGTINVDGTSTTLYAPTPPTASTTTPSMDGTASYGSGTSYARSNHVHPTDTSRQAALVSGTNIKTVNNTTLLGSGNVAVQPTLVSGTNIKTVNSTSLLGSGNVAVQATLVSGTNIKTINNQSILGSGDLTVGGSTGWNDITDKPFSRSVIASHVISYDSAIYWYYGEIAGIVYAYLQANNPSTIYVSVDTTVYTYEKSGSGYYYVLAGNTGVYISVEHDYIGYRFPTAFTNKTVSWLGPETINAEELPVATTSAFGAVKPDGTTITVSDGVISAAGGGGGGINKLVLYTDSNRSNVWVDQARTTTLLETYDYDYNAAKSALADTDVIVIWNAGMDRMYWVIEWIVDPIEDELYFLIVFGQGSSAQFTGIYASA